MASVSLSEALATPTPARRTPGVVVARLREDRGWLALAVLALLGLTAIPYLVAGLAGPPDLVRVGTFWFFRDFTQYLGAMHDAAAGAWLLHDRFSAEPHRAIVMYVPYVLLGKLAGLLGMDPLLLYYPVEVASRVALALALALFMATFLESGRARRTAYLLAAFTLGLAAWVIPLRLLLQAVGWTGLLQRLPETVNVYLEMNSFGVFLSAPHLMLGLALTLSLPTLYLAAVGGRAWWPLALAALCLGLVHPFNLPVVLSVFGLDAAWRLRAGNWRPLLVLVPAGILAAPLLLYNAWLFHFDPFWSGTYGVQNEMPAPSPALVWVDFGVVLLLAPLGLWLLRPFARPEQRLLLIWVLATFAWMYAPVVFQRRLGFGLQPGLAALAALGLLALLDRLRGTRVGTRPLNYLVTIAALGTSVLVFVSLVSSAATNRPAPVYLWTRSEQGAANWLAQHSDERDVVLSSIETGNALIGTISGRVVVGHLVATLHDKDKEALAKRFFAADTPAEERSRLLAESAASYVFVGPQERKLGVAELDGLPALEQVYRAPDVTLYRVRGGA